MISATFDAIEIRNAFLRVFVVLLADFVDNYTAAATAAAAASSHSNNHSHKNNNNGSHDKNLSNLGTTSDTSASAALIPFHADGTGTGTLTVKDSVNYINANRKDSCSSISSVASATVQVPVSVPKSRMSFLKLGLISKPKLVEVENEQKPPVSSKKFVNGSASM